MDEVQASGGGEARAELFAPGKLFVFGEWSVLFGAPALLVPTEAGQYGALTLHPAGGAAPTLRYEAPAVQARARAWSFEGSAWHEQGAEPAPDALDLIGATLEEAAARGLRPMRSGLLRVEPRGLQAAAAAGGVKLGFGSSASACALTARALALMSAAPPDADALLQLAAAAHRRAQGGGSGADVAVSLLGVDTLLRLSDPPGLDGGAARAPRIAARPAPRPEGLTLLAAWTGIAADTRALMARARAARERAAGAFDAAMDDLIATSREAASVWLDGDASGVVRAAAASAAALAAFGAATRVPIVIEAHHALGALVAAAGGLGGAAVKPSGAGGGDMALIVVDEPGRAARIEAALAARGVLVVPLTPTPRSAHPEPDASSHRGAHLQPGNAYE